MREGESNEKIFPPDEGVAFAEMRTSRSYHATRGNFMLRDIAGEDPRDVTLEK